jgi:nucleotide-binding universal stress UspA family protein
MTATPVGPGYAVAAVDGTEEGYAAVSFAAKEAARLGLELRLAHVMPAYLPVGPLLMGTDHGLGGYASETLASAARVAAEAEPHVEISTHVLMGSRVSEIVDLAENAQFVVVGRRRSSALDRAWSGGTLDGIVSRASCPVYVVPDLDLVDGRRPRVVIGYKSAAHSAELFKAGFRAAEELGGDIEVVHAWKLSSGYDDLIARRVSEATSNRELKAAIRELLAPWQEAFINVPVRIRVVHEYPARALVEASRGADRLVLVKPLHGRLLHHLGRTARAVLRFSQCPVEVVPARSHDEPTRAPVVVEREGSWSRDHRRAGCGASGAPLADAGHDAGLRDPVQPRVPALRGDARPRYLDRGGHDDRHLEPE